MISTPINMAMKAPLILTKVGRRDRVSILLVNFSS